jgi:hypothetical protein
MQRTICKLLNGHQGHRCIHRLIVERQRLGDTVDRGRDVRRALGAHCG